MTSRPILPARSPAPKLLKALGFCLAVALLQVTCRSVCGTCAETGLALAPNTLSGQEQSDGFELLFDGESTRGWRGFRSEQMPAGWTVEDGTLTRSAGGGDVITEQQFADFELHLQWKISPGGNSGIFFHVSEEKGGVYETGPEMQVLDNDLHPDGANPMTSAGANYAMHAPPEDVTRPVGEWNTVRLRIQDGHVQHWLNGVPVVEYQLGSPEWEALLAKSKFTRWPGYGKTGRGHIALQDHGDPVWYRNIRVKRLD